VPFHVSAARLLQFINSGYDNQRLALPGLKAPHENARLYHFSKYCSLHKKFHLKMKLFSDRPEPVEELTFRSWFDPSSSSRLTTNRISMWGECGCKIKKNAPCKYIITMPVVVMQPVQIARRCRKWPEICLK
jgi:hypothetical protein